MATPSPSSRPRRAALATTMSATLLLAACGGGGGGGQDAASTGTPAPVPTLATAPATGTGSAAPGEELAFGRAHTYPSGVSVTVGAPAVHDSNQPSSATTGAPQGATERVSLQVTVANKGKHPVDEGYVRFRATTGGEDTPQVFDDVATSDHHEIAPGESATWKIAFDRVPDKPFELEMSKNEAPTVVYRG